MALVSFIGIGAQKCASTWLHGALAQFGEVAVSEPKELDFFSSYFDRGYEWYERFMQADGSRRLRGEVSPSYFIDADAPARAAAYNPAMKILVTLRDPVERAFSNHLHEVRAGHVTGDNTVFEKGLANNPLYRDQGLYARHLARWLAAFPAQQVHVTFQEDVKADSLAQARRLAAFLGVAMPENLVQRRANESIDYRNRLIGNAFWRIGRAARRGGLGAAVERIKTTPGIRQLRQANQKDMRAAIAAMTPETQAELVGFFRSDVEALGHLVGRAPPWDRFR